MGQPGQQHEGTDGFNNMRELMGQPGQQHEGTDGSTRSTT